MGRNNNNNNVGCSLPDYKRSLYYPPIFIISFITRSRLGFYLSDTRLKRIFCAREKKEKNVLFF